MILLRTLIFVPALFVAISATPDARGDEFTDVCNGFGTVTTLIGMHQSTTNNPDGTPINFWQPSFEGAPTFQVALSNPHMAQADVYGNIYIADKSSHSILKVTIDGLVHTLAGTHTAGFNGDGPALGNTLQLNNPNGLFVFADGTVYILDPGNHRIRRITPDGMMTTIVNDPDPNWYPSGRALWVSSDQQLIYYTNEFAPVPPSTVNDGSTVKQWTPSGGIQIVCSKSVGFYNPGNIAVNPVDGKLYVCDRAESDPAKIGPGLFRIDGIDQRTRITGNINSGPVAATGQLAIQSFLDEPRGIAFLPDGAYFICGHTDGPIWYVDTEGVLHDYIRGKGSKDTFVLPGGTHPPLISTTYFCQPRCVTIAPNGTMLCLTNDSGFLFRVTNVVPPVLPTDFQTLQFGADGLHLGFTGIFGQGYMVQRSPALDVPNWQVVGAVNGIGLFNGVGGLTQFLDPGAVGMGQAFYRLAPAVTSGAGGAARPAGTSGTTSARTSLQRLK